MLVEQGVGQRNSKYRKISEAVLEKPIKWIDRYLPFLTADHISLIGAGLGISGIHIMEEQNRANKYSPKKTLAAVLLVGVGFAMDLFDGKLARKKRGELETDQEKYDDEKIGQVKDPVFDSIIETAQILESAYTAKVKKDNRGVSFALFNLATSNLPRTFKALAGTAEKSVPEAYKFYDPRFFGTSLGRKIPNLLATFVPITADYANIIAGAANFWVASERLKKTIDGYKGIFSSEHKKEISDKETDFAYDRAKYLALQSILNIEVAVVTARIFKKLNPKS